MVENIRTKAKRAIKTLKRIRESLDFIGRELQFWFYTTHFWPACFGDLQGKVMKKMIKCFSTDTQVLVQPDVTSTSPASRCLNNTNKKRTINTLVQFWDNYPLSYSSSSSTTEPLEPSASMQKPKKAGLY